MQSASTVRIAAPGAGERIGWLLLLAMVWLTLAVPLGWLSEWDPGEMWSSTTRGLAIGTVVLGLLLVVLTARTVRRLPAAIARREIVVDAEGLMVVERPKWWHQGARARIGWDDVQVVSAQVRAAGPVLELYLSREVPGLPVFAAVDLAAEDDTQVDGIRVPAPRLSVGGVADPDAAPALAEALGARRPDLFYAGTGVDQWFTPPRRATAPAVPPVAPSLPEEPAPSPAPDLPRPAGPVWLDHGETWPRVLLAILAQIFVLGGGVYLMNDPFGLPTAPAALIALALLVPVLFCCLTLPVSLWLLPRFTAGAGILVSAEGLEIVRKRRWRPRQLERSTVSWHWVQAAVTRRAFDVAATPAGRRRVVDLYLYDNARLPVPLPGVGSDAAATLQPTPDAVGTGRLVRYPAIRLRLTYRHDLEPRGRDSWPPAHGDGAPARLPAHQLRPALLAFRPQVCHGFDDLWEGVGRRRSVRVGR